MASGPLKAAPAGKLRAGRGASVGAFDLRVLPAQAPRGGGGGGQSDVSRPWRSLPARWARGCATWPRSNSAARASGTSSNAYATVRTSRAPSKSSCPAARRRQGRRLHTRRRQVGHNGNPRRPRCTGRAQRRTLLAISGTACSCSSRKWSTRPRAAQYPPMTDATATTMACIQCRPRGAGPPQNAQPPAARLWDTACADGSHGRSSLALFATFHTAPLRRLDVLVLSARLSLCVAVLYLTRARASLAP